MKASLALLILVIIVAGSPNKGHAELPYIQAYITDANKSGEARLKFLMWDVYDATLYLSNNHDDKAAPLALQLDYLMKLKGSNIAERSIKEIRDQGYDNEQKLSEWSDKLNTIFPDVDKGISITGIRDKNGNTLFYKNGTKIGQINDLEFTQAFFDIWLGPKTSQPKMRKQLLGLN